jgi:hypothetical protein
MTAQGHPRAIFSRAIEKGNLGRGRARSCVATSAAAPDLRGRGAETLAVTRREPAQSARCPSEHTTGGKKSQHHKPPSPREAGEAEKWARLGSNQ